MSVCERRDICGFCNNKLRPMPVIAANLKKHFCYRDKENCARYMVHQKLRQGYAPKDEGTLHAIARQMNNLYPNDTAMAGMIIRMLTR